MEESLKWDQLVLLAGVEGLTDRSIVLEVVMELEMEDRKERHRCIEILFLLMEIKVHSAEIDLQLSRVLLLLEELLLSFSLLPGLALLELFLSLAGFTLLLLVVFLLIGVLLLLFLTRLGLGNASETEEFFSSCKDGNWLRLITASCLAFKLANEKLRFGDTTVGELNVKVVLDKIVLQGFSFQRNQLFYRIIFLFKFFFHFREHGVVKLGEELEFAGLHDIGSWGERKCDLHDVSKGTKGAVVPDLFGISLGLETVFQGHCANITILKLIVDAHSKQINIGYKLVD